MPLSPKHPVRWVSLQAETVVNVKELVRRSQGKYRSAPDFIRKATEEALKGFSAERIVVLDKALLEEIVSVLKIAPGVKTPQRFVELACRSALDEFKQVMEEF